MITVHTEEAGYARATVAVITVENAFEISQSSKLPRSIANQRTFDDLNERVITDGYNDWRGGSAQDINDALDKGWPTGMRIVDDLSERIGASLPAPKSYRRRQRWAEDGDEPSWEREQRGYTDVWRTAQRRTMRGPATVELTATWGATGDVR